MILGTYTKEPAEVRDLAFDFGPDVQAGDTLDSFTLTATNVATSTDSTATLIAASPAPQISGSQVLYRIQAGSDGETHNIDCLVTTDLGEKHEGHLVLFIVKGS